MAGDTLVVDGGGEAGAAVTLVGGANEEVGASLASDGGGRFQERHDLEQYFWSPKTVLQLTRALDPSTWICAPGHVCCLAAPSLAHAFHTANRTEALLDIDTRFDYLPGFRYFDLGSPAAPCERDDFRIVVFDPPFFYIPLPTLFQGVVTAVKGDFNTKLMMTFLKRNEAALLQTFAPFHLRRTKAVLEYSTIKPNKWRNFALYSNVDLPGIKRITMDARRP